MIVDDDVVNHPHECSAVSPSAGTLWPPNHQLHPVQLGGATDPDDDPVVLTVTGVTQDEPVQGSGEGSTSPDAVLGPGSHEVQLRAERSGNRDGRVYRIAFTAADPAGATCSGVVIVGVPHSGRGLVQAIDSGDTFDSLAT